MTFPAGLSPGTAAALAAGADALDGAEVALGSGAHLWWGNACRSQAEAVSRQDRQGLFSVSISRTVPGT